MWNFFEKLMRKPMENVSFCYMDGNGNMIRTDDYKKFAKYLNDVAEKVKDDTEDDIDDDVEDDASDLLVDDHCCGDCEACDHYDLCDDFDDELCEPEELTVFEVPVVGVAALAGVLFGAAALIRAIKK